MHFNFSSPEYLSPHKRRKNRVSPVSRASPAHMNSPLASSFYEYNLLFGNAVLLQLKLDERVFHCSGTLIVPPFSEHPLCMNE